MQTALLDRLIAVLNQPSPSDGLNAASPDLTVSELIHHLSALERYERRAFSLQ
jgi:hypothetical protein